MRTCVCRVDGYVQMLVGFLLLASRLTVLVGVIPFFETMADIGAFMLALLLALPLTLIVIAAAWITHRPLIGGALIVAGLGLAYLPRRLHRARAAQPPAHFLPTSPCTAATSPLAARAHATFAP